MGHKQPTADGVVAPTAHLLLPIPHHQQQQPYHKEKITRFPVLSILVHYFRRKGVFMVLACMGVIAYLHYRFLLPQPLESPSLDYGPDMREGYLEKMSRLRRIAMDLSKIQEPPITDPGSVHDVGKDGYESSGKDLNALLEKEGLYSKWISDSWRFSDPLKRHQIQFQFDSMGDENTQVKKQKKDEQRQLAVKKMIQHAWAGYFENAAPRDELKPATGGARDTIHGWGSTLVESISTLSLAGLLDARDSAKQMLLDHIQEHQWKVVRAPTTQGRRYSKSLKSGQEEELDFFESTVKYLGGLLSIAESDPDRNSEVLGASTALAEKLVQTFKGPTPNIPDRDSTPKKRWTMVSLASIGTLQLEFRKLSQLTENKTFENLAQANADYFASLNLKIPGLFPVFFDPTTGPSSNYIASFGSLSGSFYESLLKTFIMTGDERFKQLYSTSIDAMHKYLISYPRKKSGSKFVLGVYDTRSSTLVPKMDHASCSASGMLALGARIFGRTGDIRVAEALMETCYMNYQGSAFPGLGADEIAFLGTESSQGREYETTGSKSPGYIVIAPKYRLRPEIVESLFVLYRITGDEKYQDYAWNIVQAIERHCKTKYGYTSLANVMDSTEHRLDEMPSYFLGQTLKYLYLIFSPPDVGSLNDYLFTTEGHLFKY